jgi:hypothetical protein
MADTSVTGDSWLDGVLGFNTAQDAGTAVSPQTVPTNVIQGSATTKPSAGGFTDFFYAGASRLVDYQLKKDAATTQAKLAMSTAQANALSQRPGLTVSPGVMVAGVLVLVAYLALRK